MAIKLTHIDFFGHKYFFKNFSYILILITKLYISLSIKPIIKNV